MTEPRFQVWLDRGGTFTDCIGRDPTTGELRVTKVPSSDRAPIDGVRKLLRLRPGEAIPPCDVRMGTTLATNALLERRGAPTALVITEGFGDALEIGDQRRPHLFALAQPPRPGLERAVLEVPVRGAAAGPPSRPALPVWLPEALAGLRTDGAESLALVVLHGHREPALEDALAAAARDAGFAHVFRSHEVSDGIGLVARGHTTVADAYLTPTLRRYVSFLQRELPGSVLRVMQSGGGLVEAGRFRGRDAVLSGPAGGVVATAWLARRAGEARAVGLDMGGTSTDVGRWQGAIDRTWESTVAGVTLRAPAVAVHTVAAGGGSLCRFDGVRLTVGPESAGADPGPLCYGDPAAREPSLTDASVVLGRLRGERFPLPLRAERAHEAFEALAERLSAAGPRRTAAQAAAGCFDVAVDRMATAIREVTVARGHDVRQDALVVFGGAGGQFACAVARRLGIRRLLFHPLAGVFSALGMGVAARTWHGRRDLGRRPVDDPDAPAALSDAWGALEALGREAMAGEAGAPRVLRRVDLRYAGSDTALTVDEDAAGADPGALRRAFEDRHARELGYRRPGHPVELATARVQVEVPGLLSPDERPRLATRPPDVPLPPTAPVWFPGGVRETPVLHREALRPDAPVAGPLLVLEDTGTVVVDPGFEARVEEDGLLIVEDRGEGPVDRPPAVPADDAADPDPVRLEVFGNRFMSIATQMGAVLQRTAMSPNIRERLDFSCAVFDADARLVANAPHIPVHLGAMSESVRAVHRAHPDPRPGDAFLTNDPAGGGSHLPDLTVVSPVHDDAGALRFFVASRGHHADVGGLTPGSMPPDSRTLEDEGVVFRAERVVTDGRFDREGVLRRLRRGPHPARRPAENLADLEAQLAANRRGTTLLRELADEQGYAVVGAYMGHVVDQATAAVRQAVGGLPDGRRTFEDAMDDGTPVVVTVEIRGDRLSIDFSGTGPASDGNLNAPRAVTVAAVLYVLRCLVGAPIPLNDGCLAPVDLHVPRGCLLDPPADRAVAGGNVETSQRVVDVLLGALGLAAASQGTMNNVTLGDDSFGYYETLGGGGGATADADGASARHVHMTNSRITDAEVLEATAPVEVRRFARRRGSGGAGRHRGGDGLVRELVATAPLRVSIMSERRTRAPFGLEGGAPGARGRNLLDGRPLPGRVSLDVAPGQVLRIETPGGGGFGPPGEPDGGGGPAR